MRLPDRYAPLGRLGVGRQGEVWLARDHVRGGEVAVKVLFPGQPAPLVRREVAALLALDLPGVVRLIDQGTTRQDDGRPAPFLVMEHVPGVPFPRLGQASWPAVLGPGAALLRVLRHVHALGIVHRDLKPDHVRVRGDHVVLLDFGAVCGPGSDAGGPQDEAGAGDERYMAPEQIIEPELVEHQADLYSVGLMLYEALAGRPPHRLSDLRRERLKGTHTPIGVLRPDLPAEAVALISALMARQPEDRPADAEAALRLVGLGAGAEIAPAFAHWGGPPPDREALAALFRGPERLFGRRSAALAALTRRALPDPVDQAAELSAWLAAGRARWDHGAVELTPADLAWLDEDIPLRPPPPSASVNALPAGLQDLHALLHVAWPGATEDQIARAHDAATLLSDLDELARGGHAARLADGRWRALTLPVHARVSAAQRRWAQALDEGAPARLRALLAAGAVEEATREAQVSAERHARLGDLVGAQRRLDQGLRLARDRQDLEGERTLLRVLAGVALAQSDLSATRVARYELARAVAQGADLVALDTLLRASELARGLDPVGALALLATLPADPDERLDRWRHALAVEAAQDAGPERHEVAQRAAEAWADERGTSTARADVQGWRGMLLATTDPVTSVELLMAAAAARPTLQGRLTALANGASGLMELGRMSEATAAARLLIAEGLAARLPVHTAVGEWVLRAVAWREGRALEPDGELVEAAAALGTNLRRAPILFTEAAFAWRGGDLRSAATWAETAAALWRDRVVPAAIMAEALALVCRGADVEAIAELAERAVGALGGDRPGLALQALGLLFTVQPALRARWQAPAIAALDALPRPYRTGLRELVDPERVIRITDPRPGP